MLVYLCVRIYLYNFLKNIFWKNKMCSSYYGSDGVCVIFCAFTSLQFITVPVFFLCKCRRAVMVQINTDGTTYVQWYATWSRQEAKPSCSNGNCFMTQNAITETKSAVLLHVPVRARSDSCSAKHGD